MASTETTLNQPHLSKQDLSTLVSGLGWKSKSLWRGFSWNFSGQFQHHGDALGFPSYQRGVVDLLVCLPC